MNHLPPKVRWVILMMTLYQAVLWYCYGVFLVFWFERPRRKP